MTDVDFAIANELALLDQSENDNAKLNQNLQNTKNKEQSENKKPNKKRHWHFGKK